MENINNSIILIGPCGVGKSLIASNLSTRLDMPILDIDDLLLFIELDYKKRLSSDINKQKEFIENQIKRLATIEKNPPLDDEELKIEKELIYKFIEVYNYYFDLLGGYEKFYDIFSQFDKSKQFYINRRDHIYGLNKVTLKLIERVFELTDSSYILSPPGSFGWKFKDTINIPILMLQEKMEKLLSMTKTVLLQPGEDYKLRTPFNKMSINNIYLLKHLKHYYANVDLEISTNELFYEPDNDFLKQRTWFDARENITKERLKNYGEISCICDEIIEFLKENENLRINH